MPHELAVLYGGSLGFAKPRLYVNFVESLDGVTAIPALAESSRLIAASSTHDRFVMGLLRAFADAVLIGAGTLHGSPRTHWTPEHAYPDAAESYAQLRRSRGASKQPVLAVLTASGRIGPHHPGFTGPAIVLTSEEGAVNLRGRLTASVEVVTIGERAPLDAGKAIAALRDRGFEFILCEGGPTLFGSLIESGNIDELFLTLSPQLAGRTADERRLSLIENVAFLPARAVAGRLLSVRRGDSHLFLRYAFA